MTHRDPRKEPQPVERWSPEYAKKPEWTARPEEILAWFAQEDLEFHYGQMLAADIPDSALQDIPVITAEEKKIVLAGLAARLASKPRPWRSLARLLRSGEVSPGLLRIVADLVDAEAFKDSRVPRGRQSSTLDPDAVRYRVGMFKHLLAEHFGHESGERKAKAIALHAHEVRAEGESVKDAQQRVADAYRRGSTLVMKITAEVAAAQTVPRKKPPRS